MTSQPRIQRRNDPARVDIPPESRLEAVVGYQVKWACKVSAACWRVKNRPW